ncbi:hypothetical protein D6C91_02095 [Aureobasidium pullulans]|uniref:Uncharacterized protein n=1 Tax=Aureobasidium pullulans TaxID=5580 RepID=A0A4V6THS0_AURPU|nr:hypothetical protein D6C91_02095 [Aureobasidium pullulans]
MHNVFQIGIGVRREALTITLSVKATPDNAETVLFYSSMSKRSFNPSTEPARGSRPLAQEDALLDSASAAKKAFQDRDQHIATLQDEFEALSMTNYQYVQTLEDRDNTITGLQQQLQDHEIVAKQLADQLEDIKQHDNQHKADHKTIVVLEAGLENLRAKYEKVLEKNHILKQRLEKSEDAVAETEVDKEQVAKWRIECDAAQKHVKENKEFKTVNTELRVLLDAATAEQSEDKKQLRIVELVRIKQMYEREIKELRSTVELTQATTTQPSQDEATEKIKTLEAQLRAARDDARTKIAELAARYHAEQDEITKHAAELEARLETAHNKTEKRIVDLEAQLSVCRNLPRTTDQDATGMNEALKKSLATVKSYFSSYHTEDESSQEIIELTRVNQVNQVDEKEIQALNSTVRNLQEGATEQNEPTKWMPEPVADIVLKLEQNLKRIEQWSRKHATDSVLNKGLVKTLFTSGNSMSTLLIDRSMAETASSGAAHDIDTWLFVSMAISAVALHCIIGDPFFAFHGDENDTSMFSAINAVGIAYVIQEIGLGDKEGSNAWRCQLFRLIEASTTHETGNLKYQAAKTGCEVSARLAKHCTLDMVDFLNPSTEAVVELANIFQAYADMAWSLWAQKWHIDVLRPAALNSKLQTQRLEYRSDSPYMDAHSLHFHVLENDEKALDGKEVLQVISPAVVVTGTADGNDYTRETVWAKAVVWMG